MSKKNYDKLNEKIFGKLLKKFVKGIEIKIEAAFQDIAKSVLEYIESPDTTPLWTGNLKDGTGLAIYKDSRLEKYFPPQRIASEHQVYEGRQIWGYAELGVAFAEGVTLFPHGIVVVLFSAVPYAEDQDDANGYFTVMTSEMEHIFKQKIKQTFGIDL